MISLFDAYRTSIIKRTFYLQLNILNLNLTPVITLLEEKIMQKFF